ncbi:hypothetical protein [Lysobacter enzymogenes]|uniref:hypothetical protein n=1 Tax=Lysobacter enzymogenes TaxID=69 RepID=UPI00089999FC|nr:hypothetical protein [Lysobacter enzymogenes]SDW85416.1 hypothetical protein SAMN05421681_10323 [Lysobacter enzymogenes]
MHILFHGSVPKHADTPIDNEDAYRVDAERGRIVVSDGASESFDAKSWSRLLVDRFLDTGFTHEGVVECVSAFADLHDPELLSWSRAAAFERGSFATLLIAQERDGDRLDILSIGDSFAALTDGQVLLGQWPYDTAEQFFEKPVLLATKAELNADLLQDRSELVVTASWKRGDLQGPVFLLCMTDALGAWLLTRMNSGDASALERLLEIRDAATLEELVERERDIGAMRRDDSTLVIAMI